MTYEFPIFTLYITIYPINTGRGGSKLISISLRGVSVLAVMVDHTLYPSNAHLSLSNSKPAMPSMIVGSQSITIKLVGAPSESGTMNTTFKYSIIL